MQIGKLLEPLCCKAFSMVDIHTLHCCKSTQSSLADDLYYFLSVFNPAQTDFPVYEWKNHSTPHAPMSGTGCPWHSASDWPLHLVYKMIISEWNCGTVLVMALVPRGALPHLVPSGWFTWTTLVVLSFQACVHRCMSGIACVSVWMEYTITSELFTSEHFFWNYYSIV